MLSPGGEIDAESPLAPLAIQSRQMYGQFVRRLEQASRLTIDYQECGGLDLAYSPDEQHALESRAARQIALGIGSKPLSRDHVSIFWPRVRSTDLAGARFYPGDAIVNPREVTRALAAACRKLNASIVERCSASRVHVKEGGVELETEQGASTFRAAVIAAGAWSGDIAVTGVPPLPASEPVKGHLIGYQQPEQTCTTVVRHGQTYLLQRANGLLIAGTSVEHAGFDRQVKPDIADGIARRAAFIFPHLRETSPSEIWTGFRPDSDQLQLGTWHSPHLYLAYGHFRNGILLAPLTAQRLCDQINANWRRR